MSAIMYGTTLDFTTVIIKKLCLALKVGLLTYLVGIMGSIVIQTTVFGL